MTVANPTNVSSGDIAGGASGTTASVTPTHNASDGCSVLWIGMQDTSASYPTGMTSVTGAGLTWTVVLFDGNTTGTTRWFIACAVGIGTPSAGTIVITPNQTVSRYAWVLNQHASGVDISSPGTWVTASDQGSATTTTPTLASADANGVVHAGAVHRVNEAITVERTSIFELSHAAPDYRLATQYNAGSGDLGLNFSWTTSQSYGSGVIAVPAVAAGVKPRNLLLLGVGR